MLTNSVSKIFRKTTLSALLAIAATANAGAPDDAPAASAEQHTAPTKAFTALAGFHAEYEASYIGFSAEATVDLRPTENPGEYVYELVTQARGLARLVRSGTARETSHFLFNEAGFTPIRYQLDDGTKKVENDTDIKFDWDAGIAHSLYKEEPKEIEITAGMLDRMTADIVTIQTLRNGAVPTSYEITDRNSVRIYEFTFQGEETVSVPAGDFHAVKYRRQRPGSSRATIIWYAPEVDYLPVKIQQLKRGKNNILMVATKLEPAAACAGCDQP